MHPVPPQYTHILWQTSMWMLIPCYLSQDPIFTLTIRCTFIFSILHWYHYQMGSTYQFMDRLFSCLTLTILAFRSSTIIPLFPVTTCFLIGHHYRTKGFFQHHLFYHLLFRMGAFFWCCQYCHHTDLHLWLTYTVLYVAHVGACVKQWLWRKSLCFWCLLSNERKRF